jgi:HK97 family phage prohead protease
MADRVHLRVADSLRPATVDEKARTVQARLLSGAPILRFDPVLYEDVLLTFDPRGGDFTRVRQGTCPLCVDHAADQVDNVIGQVTAARVQGDEVFVDLSFGSTPKAEAIFRRVVAGELRAISGGFEVAEYSDSRDAEGRLMRSVTQWSLYEVSIVSTPADPKAVILSMSGEKAMTNPVSSPAPAAAPDLGAQINRMVTAAGLPATVAVELAAECDTLEAAREKVLARLAAQADKVPTRAHTSISVTRDGGDTRREALALALQHRVRGGEPHEMARPYLHLTLPEVARECLAARGERITGFSPARVVELAMTTSDFPAILGNFANKSLLDAYQKAEPAIKRLCRMATAVDFKERRVLRIGEGTPLAKTAEGAEHLYGSVGEWKQSYAVETWARIYSLTRQAIVNDDLGAFDQFVRNLGYLAADAEARVIVNLLTANAGAGPVLDDGFELFHINHGNVAGSGGAIGETTLDTARAAMRTQKGVDGELVIDAEPAYILVPAARQTTAEKMIAAITPNAASSVNPFAGRLEAIAEPRLDAASTTAWYLFAAPDRVPVFEFAYLEGANGPTVQSEVDFDTDAVKYKVRVDFGVGVVDYRGAYKNPGA